MEVNEFNPDGTSLEPHKTDLKDMKWMDRMIEVLQNKAGGDAQTDHFYQTLINNKLSQISTNMRISFEYYDGGIIPANVYAFLLATSGASKGKTNSTLEELFFNEFKNDFLKLFMDRAKASIDYLGEQRALSEGMPEDQAIALINKRFNDLPTFLYTYNDATEAGYKAIREKLTIASIGSTNIELDEIGINMHKIEEFLSSVLEAYDTGKLKQKLVKMESSQDATAVPSTFLSFGTGSTLLDGGDMEKKFTNMLRQGMARRCCFAYSDSVTTDEDILVEFDALAVLRAAKCSTDTADHNSISEKFRRLANDLNIGKIIKVPDHIWAQMLEYKHRCTIESAHLSEFDDLTRLNLLHSYWQLSKLMSIYAFIDGYSEVEQHHFDYALDYVLNSHKNFTNMIRRKSNFERIAEFICMSKKELTLFDLNDALPFYKSGNKQQKQEMLDLAQAYAATHHMVIKHTIKEGIEYFSGSMLEKSNLDQIILSTSSDITKSYSSLFGRWDDLYLVPTSNTNYSAHHFMDGDEGKGYRNGDNALKGFNLVILDVDNSVDIETAKAILEGQKYLICTTKNHKKDKDGITSDRYRIFLPVKYTLCLDTDEYKSFMSNIMDEFPINVDPACKDNARFYYGHSGAEYYYGEGELFDPTPYIQDTKGNEKRVATNKELADIGSLERWFLKRMSIGDRNDNLLKFALALVDDNVEFDEISERVHTLNNKLAEPITEREINSTVLKTTMKKIVNNEGQ